jgi:hypothetical protein
MKEQENSALKRNYTAVAEACLLFCISLLLGSAIVVFSDLTYLFYTKGIVIITAAIAFIFIFLLILWQVMIRKSRFREPEKQVRHHGNTFRVWFATHNLFWAFIATLFIFGLFKLFGPRGWVMALSAGALACIVFVFIGAVTMGKQNMLGLCWQSDIPGGLKDFWSQLGASIILRHRYLYAVKEDQNRKPPLLWSIFRIFDRKDYGGANRGVELMPPGISSKKNKMEYRVRLKGLGILFAATVIFSSLPGLLGLTQNSWNHVPDGWPKGLLQQPTKNSDKKNPPKNEKREEKKEGKEDTESSNRQDKNDQAAEKGDSKEDANQQSSSEQGESQNQSTPDSTSQTDSQEGSEKGAQKQSQENGSNGDLGDGKNNEKSKKSELNNKTAKSTDPGQDGEQKKGQESNQQSGPVNNRDQKSKEGQQGKKNQQNPNSPNSPNSPKSPNSPNSQQGNQNRQNQSEQKNSQGRESQKNQSADKQQPGKKGNRSQQGQPKQQGKEGQKQSGQSGQQGQQGQQSGSKSQGKGNQQGQSGQQGKSSQQGQQNQQSGQSNQKGQQGNQKGDQKGKGDPNQSQQSQDSDGSGDSGESKGYGSGSPNDIPKMSSGESALEQTPAPPSRSTDMVNLDLPTLSTENKNDKEKSIKDKKGTKKATKKYQSPFDRYKTGKQTTKATKPEQYLPNWILNLIKIKKEKNGHKNTKTRRD